MMAALQILPLRGELLFDEPLARHTSWRVGGPARRFYRPADSADLQAFLQQLPMDEPLLWLGLGSNLLVRDGGFPGTVIATRGRLESLRWLEPDLMRAEAGVSCAAAARFAARAGRVGIQFLAGIPGTIGGALAMNAGAFGGETWDQVKQLEMVDRGGVIRHYAPTAFEVGYRSVTGPQGEWFLAAQLQVTAGDVAAAQQTIRELLARRNQSQPIGQPSCGSVFRNPQGDHAARLIEAAGLKGLQIGGARVSDKHANFIINADNASAADIERLIEQVQQRVAQTSGVRLQTEVRMVGVAGRKT